MPSGSNRYRRAPSRFRRPSRAAPPRPRPRVPASATLDHPVLDEILIQPQHFVIKTNRLPRIGHVGNHEVDRFDLHASHPPQETLRLAALRHSSTVQFLFHDDNVAHNPARKRFRRPACLRISVGVVETGCRDVVFRITQPGGVMTGELNLLLGHLQ